MIYICSYFYFVNCFGFFKSFFLPFLFCGLMLWFDDVFLELSLDCFFFSVCVYSVCAFIVDFWFLVTVRFGYTHTQTHKICLSFWSFNFKCLSNIYSHNLFAWELVLISYLCADDFLPVLYVHLYWWAFSFVIFLFLVVAFSTQRRSFSICCKKLYNKCL